MTDRLVEPDLEQRTLRLPDGRRLQVHLGNWGLGADAPVLVSHHGTPSWGHPGRATMVSAVRHGVRVVGPTRPGYAGSTPQPGRDVAAVASDVAAVLDQLGVGRAVVMGASGGGPHALATAALLPDRIAAVASIAGVAPYDVPGLEFLAGMGEENIREFGAALDGEATLRPYLEAERPQVAGVTADQLAQALDSLLPPVDRALVTGALADELVESFGQALSAGVDGWTDDDLAFTRDWGFPLEALAGVPVSIWQGEVDLMVPVTHGRWLASALPEASVHLLPDDGHLSIAVGRMDEILTELLASL